MAELSYSDIQRAVYDGSRETRELMMKLSRQLERIVSLENQLINMRHEIEGMRRQINATNIQVSAVLNRPQQVVNAGDARLWQQLGNSIHSIEVRLAAMQQYMQSVNDYFTLLNDRNTEGA